MAWAADRIPVPSQAGVDHRNSCFEEKVMKVVNAAWRRLCFEIRYFPMFFLAAFIGAERAFPMFGFRKMTTEEAAEMDQRHGAGCW